MFDLPGAKEVTNFVQTLKQGLLMKRRNATIKSILDCFYWISVLAADKESEYVLTKQLEPVHYEDQC